MSTEIIICFCIAAIVMIDNEEEGKKKEWNDIQNYTYVSKFAVCMTSIIGCRAVLWQIVPYLSILSVSA